MAVCAIRSTQKGWRYEELSLPWTAAPTIADSEEELPYYYVRDRRLEAVLGAYYDKYQEIFSQEENRQEYLEGYIQFIDRSLFVDGSFCSPELEHLWESYLMAKQMAENTEG